MQAIYDGHPIGRTATRGAIRIVEDALAVNGVTRAADLPEEARVRLFRRLSRYLSEQREAYWRRQTTPCLWNRLLDWWSGR